MLGWEVGEEWARSGRGSGDATVEGALGLVRNHQQSTVRVRAAARKPRGVRDRHAAAEVVSGWRHRNSVSRIIRSVPVFITEPVQSLLIGYRQDGSQVASSRASDWAGSVCYKRRAHSDC